MFMPCCMTYRQAGIQKKVNQAHVFLRFLENLFEFYFIVGFIADTSYCVTLTSLSIRHHVTRLLQIIGFWDEVAGCGMTTRVG